MGRTLHYSIPRTGNLTRQDIAEILVVQALWNHAFTWTCEELSWQSPLLHWFPRWPFWFPDSRLPKEMTPTEAHAFVGRLLKTGITIPDLVRMRMIALHRSGKDRREAPLLEGFTKVRDDEWNAYLVCAFAKRVSDAFPGIEVHLSDEGSFVLAGSVIFTSGKVRLDEEQIRHQRGYLESRGFAAHLAALDDAVAKAKDGEFFAEVPASEYLDRKECKDVRLEENEQEAFTTTLIDHGRVNSEGMSGQGIVVLHEDMGSTGAGDRTDDAGDERAGGREDDAEARGEPLR